MEGLITKTNMGSLRKIIIISGVVLTLICVLRVFILYKDYLILDIIIIFILAVFGIRVGLFFKNNLEEVIIPYNVVYNGLAIHSGNIVYIAFCLLMGLPFLISGIYSLNDFGLQAIIPLIFGLAFISIGIIALINIFRSKLIVEEKGIIWAQAINFRSRLQIFMPFTNLTAITVSGRIVKIYGKNHFGPNWFIIQNPDAFKTSLKRFASDKLRICKRFSKKPLI